MPVYLQLCFPFPMLLNQQLDYMGPMSLPPRGGPLELLVGVPDAHRDRRTRRRLQVCLVPFSGSFWDVNTWFRRDSRVSRVNGRVDFGGDFKAAMSLGQSPLATSSGVGSSGWAILQRRQDIIREGDCDSECDNEGVHKGLVFMVIVTLSSLSFLTSTILFSLLTSWWSSFRWFCCGQDAFRRVWNVGWNRGVARGACCVLCVGGSAGPRFCRCCIEAGFLL